MKIIILIIVLVVCSTAFGQTKSKRQTKKRSTVRKVIPFNAANYYWDIVSNRYRLRSTFKRR